MKIEDFDVQRTFVFAEPEPPSWSLGEPSLADVLLKIAASRELSGAKKLHWASSLRRLAEWIGKRPEVLPARLKALRPAIARLVAAAHDVTDKTLANHKSNLKAALSWYGGAGPKTSRGAPLALCWEDGLAQLKDVRTRRLLGAFARYCSARSILPRNVTSDTIASYFEHLETTSFRETGLARRREVIRAWNAASVVCEDWLGTMIAVPNLVSRVPVEWQAFPEGLRRDVEAYLLQLNRPHRSSTGRRRRGCKASTLATRRRELQGFARKAVAAGASIASLDNLHALLSPDVVRPALEAYLGQDERAQCYVIDLGWKLLSIAKAIGSPSETIASLEEIRDRLEEDRGPVLTSKNLAVIRAVLMGDLWSRVISLPDGLLKEAEYLHNRSPKKAKALAARALQILILTRAPLRIGNLMAMRIGLNLLRPGGRDAPFLIDFPDYDVKNRVDLQYPLTAATSGLIDRYLLVFHPNPVHGAPLFAAETGNQRSSAHASAAIATLLEQRIGMRITAHQFRHAAAAVILKKEPGNFEFVRRVLGHLNQQTTVRFYTALESFQATKIFGELVDAQRVSR